METSAKALILRTCAVNMTSYNGFVWPASGSVEAVDWVATAECGHGLHGLLWGEGDGSLLDWTGSARWLVVEINAVQAIDLGGKVKFPRGIVVHCGDRKSATAYLKAHGGEGKAIVGDTTTAGDYGTATAGDNGTATAGDNGTATAGDYGTATAGDYGTATAGYNGIIILNWFDTKARRRRVTVGYIGENCEANKKYRVDGEGQLMLVLNETS